MLTQDDLKTALNYDEISGVFTWKISSGRRAIIGNKAGAYARNGYVVIRHNKILYKAHRLAWLYVYGVWPANNLDHINRITSDNRIANLRIVNQSENMQNMSLHKNNLYGCAGICWDKKRKKYSAKIKLNYKTIHLGRFENLNDAILARKTAEKIYHTHAVS